jgi:hypothetical protein
MWAKEFKKREKRPRNGKAKEYFKCLTLYEQQP